MFLHKLSTPVWCYLSTSSEFEITDKHIDQQTTASEKVTAFFFKWFTDNQMKANNDKCYTRN